MRRAAHGSGRVDVGPVRRGRRPRRDRGRRRRGQPRGGHHRALAVHRVLPQAGLRQPGPHDLGSWRGPSPRPTRPRLSSPSAGSRATATAATPSSTSPPAPTGLPSSPQSRSTGRTRPPLPRRRGFAGRRAAHRHRPRPQGRRAAPARPPLQGGTGRPGRTGTQYFSTISLRDWIEAATFLATSDLEGPFNLTAPNPVTNPGSARRWPALHRPAVLPAPAWPLRLAGPCVRGDPGLGAGPAAPLLEAGFTFSDPDDRGTDRRRARLRAARVVAMDALTFEHVGFGDRAVDYNDAWALQRAITRRSSRSTRHRAAARAPARLHRRPAHRAAGAAARRHAGHRRRPRRQDHLPRPRPAGRLPDLRLPDPCSSSTTSAASRRR